MKNELYFDPFTANLYDSQYNFHSGDLKFYMEECQAAMGKILEIACGTGRLFIPLLDSGCYIDGLDYSKNMLDVLRKKLSDRNLKADLYNQSMLDFSINRKYALIFIPFTSLFIMNTQQKQMECLRNCHRHLEEDGKLILDFFINSYIITLEQDRREKFFKELEQDGKRILIFETVINDIIKQLKTIMYKYEFYNPDGTMEKVELRQLELRWIYPDELKLMAELTGFKKVQLFGGFERRPLRSNDNRLVAVLEK